LAKSISSILPAITETTCDHVRQLLADLSFDPTEADVSAVADAIECENKQTFYPAQAPVWGMIGVGGS
jgi:hypothetical protein